ncbi:MAG: hypothetical protein Kow0099_01930 [Candidatus Abyssubacteria bacterium]
MAINRGTRKAIFVHFLETFSILGVLGGAGWGIYQALGANPFDLLMNALRFGVVGFVLGSAAGVVLGLLAVLSSLIFR